MEKNLTVVQQIMSLAAKRREAGVSAVGSDGAGSSPLAFLRRGRAVGRGCDRPRENWGESA